MPARTYQEMDVWKLCDEVRQLVVEATAKPSVVTHRKFCDQICGAAENAASDVAEGFARFRPREFAQFLGYAISSLAEVRERTRHGQARRLFEDETAAAIIRTCVRADKAARSLRHYLWTVRAEDVPSAPASRPRRSGRREGPSRRTAVKNVREEPSSRTVVPIPSPVER
jgi:four helix bundle protein